MFGVATRNILTALVLCLVPLGAVGEVPAGRPAAVDYSDYQIIRSKVASETQLEALESAGIEVLNCVHGPGSVDLLVAPEHRAVLDRLRLPVRVLQDDVGGWIDRERAMPATASGDAFADFFLGYHRYGDFDTSGTILWYLGELVARYPSLASLIEIGTTVQGRTIWGLRVSGSAGSDKPGVVFFGTEHAREWVTSMVPPYVATHLLEHYATDEAIRDLVDNVEFFLIPVHNVDGYEFSWTTNRFWRKNLAPNSGGSYGVDLNRNWGKEWGGAGSSSSQSSSTYRGPVPFSEPETQAMRDFFLAHPNIRAQLDIHNYSQLILWPNAYTNALPPDQALFTQIGNDMRSLIFGVHNKDYIAGATYGTLYPAAGVSFDWTYHELGILSMTIECRDDGTYGFQLPAAQIIPQCEELLPAMLYYANTPWVRAEAPLPVVSAAGSRYLSIELADAPPQVALRVTSPDEPCLLLHVADQGFLQALPSYRYASEWGTIAAGDSMILPQTTYHVQAVYAGIGPTHPVAVTTGMLGDVAPPFGFMNLRDIREMARAFSGDVGALPPEWCDLVPVVPDGLVDFADINRAVETFQGMPSDIPHPCP